MRQELHKAVPHGSSKYSQEKAGVPTQEDPLPPEGSPKGSAHSAASWLGWPGKLFVLAKPGRETPPHFVSARNNYPRPGTAPGAALGHREQSTGVDNSIQEWFILSASPEEVPQLLHGLPLPPRFKEKEKKKVWRRLRQR